MSRLELQADQAALVAALSSSTVEVKGLRGLGPATAGLRRGLLAYRVNAQALACRALAAVYSPLRDWLGAASFEGLAWAFWRASPPQRGDLAEWGEGLADYLAAQAEMEDLPCQLARLCWAAHRVEAARDAELDAPSLALLAQREPQDLGLRLRPGVCLVQASPAALACWRAAPEAEIEAGGEQTCPVLVWRQAWVARARVLAAGEHVFLQALLAGEDLDTALHLAFSAQADFDFGICLQTLLQEDCLWAAYEIETKES